MVLQVVGLSGMAWLFILAPLTVMVRPVAGTESPVETCGDLKKIYNDEKCCGKPNQDLSFVPGAADCPYNFAKPSCTNAEPQAPRDLSTGATGKRTPKQAVLTEAQANYLPLTNVHFHLGAEHKSDEYKDDTKAKAYDAGRRLADNARPGFMCTTDDLTEDQKKAYTFQSCTGETVVGNTYEIHYVHSSAGFTDQDIKDSDMTEDEKMQDGLGGAANGRGMLNPMVAVQGQVFQIVNGAQTINDMLHGWTEVRNQSRSVMYAGSTTGPSHNNDVCSPYAITWHVDTECHRVSPESFDKLCKDMKDLYKLSKDLAPHGSRQIVSSDHVVKAEYVKPLV